MTLVVEPSFRGVQIEERVVRRMVRTMWCVGAIMGHQLVRFDGATDQVAVRLATPGDVNPAKIDRNERPRTSSID